MDPPGSRLLGCDDGGDGPWAGNRASRARNLRRAHPVTAPVALAQQALTTQLACRGRFTLGLGPSHHWLIEEQWGLEYDKPALLVRHYLEVLHTAFAGPGSVDVENDAFRVHSPMNVIDAEPMPILISALAPVMLRLAGEQTSGTILWMADEKAISDHVIPRITKAAKAAGRPAPRIVAGVPVALCSSGAVDAARVTAKEVLGHADFSPNYRGCSNKATPATSTTSWRSATSPRSQPGCAAIGTRASPISWPGSCPSGRARKSASGRAVTRASSSPH